MRHINNRFIEPRWNQTPSQAINWDHYTAKEKAYAQAYDQKCGIESFAESRRRARLARRRSETHAV